MCFLFLLFHGNKQCPSNLTICEPCSSDYVDCYVLDDNGFVVVSETHKYTGRFFGEIHGGMMNELVDRQIYERTTVVDYQAICHHLLNRPGVANMLLNVSLSLTGSKNYDAHLLLYHINIS